MPKPEAAAAHQDWAAHLAREEARYRDGEARLSRAGSRRPLRSGEPPAPADPDGERGGRGCPRAPDGRPAPRGSRVVRARRRALPGELPGSPARQLGPADRRDQGTRARGRLGQSREGSSLDARGRSRRSRVPDWRLRGRACAARPRPGPRGTRSRRRDPDPRRLPARRRRCARVYLSARHPRLCDRDRVGAGVVRGAGRVPRGPARRRHRARPSGARRPARHGRRAELAAASRTS